MNPMVGVSAQGVASLGPLVARPPHQPLRIALFCGLLLSLLVALVSVAGLFMLGAVVAAGFVIAFFVALVALRLGERPPWPHRRVAAVRSEVGLDEPEVLEVSPDLPADSIVAERAEWRLGLAVAAPLAALAVLLAGFLVGWRIAGLGALAFFGMMLLMGAPVWLAAVEDQIEEAEERAELPHPPSIR